MASQFDDSDFIDRDYQREQAGYSNTSAGHAVTAGAKRPPTRAELEGKLGEAQQKLAELRRAQDELERERTALEEARRRRLEFQTGREEMLQHLTRGVALLEQAEFSARRDAEQMAKSLGGLREALLQVGSISEESWTQENWNVELTKSLAAVENARLEWNGARLKWPLLNGEAPNPMQAGSPQASTYWDGLSFWQLCRLGAALTWPVALVVLLGLIVWLVRSR